MYTLVFQKYMGDKPQFVLTEQLHKFLEKTEANGIIVFPGFLSRNDSTIEYMLRTLYESTGLRYLGMGNPCDGKKNAKVYLSMYKNKWETKGGSWLEIKRNWKRDHSKVLAIFKAKDPYNFAPIIDEASCEAFLSNIEIIGMMIGSSNFSKTTYYGNEDKRKIRKADKGETDVFMFWGRKDSVFDKYEANEEFVKDISDLLAADKPDTEERQYRMILSESKTYVPSDYFEKILRNKLIKTISKV